MKLKQIPDLEITKFEDKTTILSFSHSELLLLVDLFNKIYSLINQSHYGSKASHCKNLGLQSMLVSTLYDNFDEIFRHCFCVYIYD